MHITDPNVTLAAWNLLVKPMCPNERTERQRNQQLLGFASHSPDIHKTNPRNNFCNLPWNRRSLTGNSVLFSLGKTAATRDNLRATAQTTENHNSPTRRTWPRGIQQEMKVIFIIEYSFLQLPEQRICKISSTKIPHYSLKLRLLLLVTPPSIRYGKRWVENWGR